VTGRDAVPEVVLRRIVVGPLETNCWVVHASGHPEALLVDPGDEPECVLDAVADLQVTGILLTHAGDSPVWPHELATLARDGHFDAGTDGGPARHRPPAAARPRAPALGRLRGPVRR
jgi:hydroxyacylglutathione hydrolase